jgi:hypothetical protein
MVSEDRKLQRSTASPVCSTHAAGIKARSSSWDPGDGNFIKGYQNDFRPVLRRNNPGWIGNRRDLNNRITLIFYDRIYQGTFPLSAFFNSVTE